MDGELLEKRERQKTANGFNNKCENGNASDTDNKGLEGCKVGGSIGGIRQKSHQQFTGCLCSTWEQFPTQSPICSGDDGLPTELDGITFSKWRNESIKGYGNAIVPQVVLQIFRAIEQFDQATD